MSAPTDISNMSPDQLAGTLKSAGRHAQFAVTLGRETAFHLLRYAIDHSRILASQFGDGGRRPAAIRFVVTIAIEDAAERAEAEWRDLEAEGRPRGVGRSNARDYSPWPPESREAALEKRRLRQAEHDKASAHVIESCRQSGLSWRAVARKLTDAGIPPPRRGRGDLAPWHPEQARRIARRLGIE